MTYVLKRWHRVNQLFLEKDVNVSKIHRFRNIHLVEADLNFVLSLIWTKKLPQYFEGKKLLQESQYGGRKKRRAQNVIQNNMYSFDLSRIL